jgi:ribose transport system substrate-binding protein
VFDAEIKTAAAKHDKEFQFEEQSAEDDPNKQTSQVETLMLKSPKVLLISPTTEAVKAAVDKVYDSGTPVVLLDRAVPGDKFTCLIASDNVEIGRHAGKFLVSRLKGHGTILMIQGLGGVTATDDRRKGAMEEFAKSPGITVIPGDDCKFQRQAAQSYMETFLQSGKPFDAVYAHNDEMAIGAYLAWSHSGAKGKKPLFVGIDGCQKEMIDYIKKGEIDATFQYSVPGPAGIEVAADLLKGNKPKDKKIVLPTQMVTKENADKYLADNPNLAK